MIMLFGTSAPRPGPQEEAPPQALTFSMPRTNLMFDLHQSALRCHRLQLNQVLVARPPPAQWTTNERAAAGLSPSRGSFLRARGNLPEPLVW